MQAFLNDLDLRWRSEPDAVLDSILNRMRERLFPRQFLPRGLGIAGSAFRIKFDFLRAERYIRKGLFFARELRNWEEAGILHQRLSFVWHHSGDNRKALKENSRAIRRHFLVSVDRVGQCLVDRGLFLGNLDENRRARDVYLAALDRLSDQTYRFCALQGLAETYVQLDQPERALDSALKAAELPSFPEAKAKLEWTIGTLMARLGRYREAVAQISIAVEQLSCCSPIDAALASVDLCTILFRCKQRTRALEVAHSMLSFIGPLRSTSLAAAGAVFELASLGKRGVKEDLTLAVLESVRARVEKAQERVLPEGDT